MRLWYNTEAICDSVYLLRNETADFQITTVEVRADAIFWAKQEIRLVLNEDEQFLLL